MSSQRMNRREPAFAFHRAPVRTAGFSGRLNAWLSSGNARQAIRSRTAHMVLLTVGLLASCMAYFAYFSQF